ncbi:hypothetical protein C5167_030251 [Papaver somniferum]|nr:hypothetical protein C5167_030251 [Papaver somniferum]
MANVIVLFSLLFIVAFPLSTNAATYNVLRYGAKPNGRTDSTRSFLRAWSLACKSKKPATMWVPRGTYLVKTIVFGGPCRSKRVTVQIDGKIQAPPGKNYRIIGKDRNWILFTGINGLTINGGIIDGRGSSFWNCRRYGGNCPEGAIVLAILNNVRNGIISGLKSIDSQFSHMAINGCKNIMVRRVTILAPDQSPNTDGIDIQSSSGVSSIQASKLVMIVLLLVLEPKNYWFNAIGSLARSRNEEGVQGIVVKDVTFTGSDNGLRIKTWPRPSNGFVKNVLYQNIVMKNVRNPIIIDQVYCPGGNSRCARQHSGIKISGVTYLNVRGTSATPIAVNLHCSATNPCNGIKLYHVRLTYWKKPATSFCYSAVGISKGKSLPGNCF